VLGVLVLLAASLGGVLFVRRVVSLPIGVSDFNAYWSAARLFWEGRNPCDLAALLAMERAHFDPDRQVVMPTWNPPTMWVFMLPLAWLPAQIARAVWLLFNILLVLVSCVLLGAVYLPPRRLGPLLTYLLLAAFFPPVLLAVLVGQITFLVLFGVAVALFLIRREGWFWAGAVLILTSVKPHLVLLVGPYLMGYAALRHKWTGWLGLAAAGAACLGVLFILRPGWLSDFGGVLNDPPADWATPTLGGILNLYGAGAWVRYVGIAGLLFVPILLRWVEQVPVERAVALLTLITLPTTFFGWSYDHSLLLVPIAQIVSWLFGPLQAVGARWAVMGAIILVLIVNLVQRAMETNDVYYFWVPLAWGGIYALSWWAVRRIGDSRVSGVMI